jgi:DNA-binding GntR family transcriptional regulator
MKELTSGLLPIQGGLTLTERVYTTIKEAILDLELMPGSPLVEDELARQLKTSKTPVRDALLALERDGLVTKIPYKGTYVSEISLKDATEIFELRAVLEGLAARLASRAFSPKELDQAEKLLEAADKARQHNDFDAASKYGADFHKTIHRCADNQRLIPILEKLDEQLRRLRRLSDQVQGRLEKSAYEHKLILAALRSGDPLQSEQAMRNHLESVLVDFSMPNIDLLKGKQETSQREPVR